MGALASRRNAGVEEVDISNANAYRYPPKSGSYFGSHFIMGGERFDTIQPEAYLFGDNEDLNFLGNRPMPFPYPPPTGHEPTKMLKSLVNIRKDSVRFVKVLDETNENTINENQERTDTDTDSTESKVDSPESNPETPAPPAVKYNVEFTFDTDVRCAITIYYFATEEITNGVAIYHPRDPSMNSETFHYKRGANQTFSQTTHVIDPSQFPEEEWQHNPDKDVIPVVIQCVVEDEPEHTGHSHVTFGTVEKASDGGYAMKPLKQKQLVDGLCYLLQEIYGIENKTAERSKVQEEDIDDSGAECVICMSDKRDTLILPCRHLCLCNGCADSLRYQANNCPICRARFRALLQVRAMQRKVPNTIGIIGVQGDPDENPVSQEGVPAGYEAVSLIEALNGRANPPAVHPLHVAPDGTVPLRPPVAQVATSPEESPIMEKRKTKRQSSIGSRRSTQEAVVVEKGEEAKEESTEKDSPGDGRGTPEVVMSDLSPDPIKSHDSPKKMALPKVRYPGPKTVLSPSTPPEGDKPWPAPDSLEVIDEVSQDTKHLQESTEAGGDGEEDTELHIVEGAEGGQLALEDTNPHAVTPPPDYEDEDEEDELKVAANPDVMFAPAAHTVVLYDKECVEQQEERESLVHLPPQVVEVASLPGTPVSSTDSSSYNSNCSTRMLLSQPAEEKTTA